MTPPRLARSSLVLLIGGGLLAPARADAMNIFVAKLDFQTTSEDLMSVGVTVDDDPSNEVASVELRVSSDGGNEDLVLTESDAWLHGGATLSALPAKDAALTLTLYDKGSASLMTFSGTLATDGTVTLGEGESSGPCEVVSKLGCTVLVEYDVEVLAADVYASGKGYALTLDLAGADTYEVAYATVVVSGGDKAEVAWDAVGSVWRAESTLEHTGVIDVKAKARDASGNTVENANAELAEPWLDAGAGVNALSAGSGTSVALVGVDYEVKQFHFHTAAMAIVSEGWTTTAYPTHAELELAGGDTVTVAANSYQRTGTSRVDVLPDGRVTFGLTINGGNLTINGSAQLTLADLSGPVCVDGTCLMLVENEKGTLDLSATGYANTTAGVPASVEIGMVGYDKSGAKVSSVNTGVSYDSAVAVVFANAIDFSEDPIGGDASGSVSLLGAADQKGRQATLSKGSFYASFSRDSDGDLSLGGYGTDEWATSDTNGSVLLGGPVECGGAGCDGDWAPPVIVYANGSGTKNASNQASTKPRLL